MTNGQAADAGQSIESRWSIIWNYIKGRPAEVKRAIAVPSGRVIDSGAVTAPFQPKKQYFAVVINEMFLEQARQWWTEYDPMALIVSEFTYDGKRITVPFVVGPSMIQAKLEQVPNGMAITDTLVSGIHPYVGGKFALTVILAQVKRQSHATKLLQLVETVGHAFPEGAALEPYLKVAGAVMDGVDALLGLADTVPIAGHRWEYNDGITPWLEPGFFALIDSDVKNVNADQLSVRKGRLFEDVKGNPAAFRRADFLLYSLRVVETRNDVNELPFYPLFQKALQAAASTEAGSWDRAKATLVTLYQEMLLSPDLTFAQAQQLAADFKTQLVAANDLAKNLVLGEGKASITLEGSAFAGDDRAERLKSLGEIHSLLAL
jgi:hypothetical protein